MDNPLRCAVFVLLISGLVGVSAGSTPPPRRSAALHDYQHDLVSVLALRADATHLLGAALLARPLQNLPENLGHEALLRRAAAADDAGPAVTWAQLTQCTPQQACPNRDALERLARQAPDNAAVWLLHLGLSASEGDSEGQRAALRKAAAASYYNDYAGVALQALAEAATSLPVPEMALAAYAGDTGAGAASAQVFLAFGLAAMHPAPGFAPLVKLCDPGVNNVDAAQLREPCLQLADTLAWGSSVQARAAGLHLQLLLAEDDAARKQAQERLADLAWQVQNFSRLSLQALTDASLARQLLQLARHGGHEMSMVYALLRDNGVPLHAQVASSPPAPASSSDTPAASVSVAPRPH